MQPRCSPDADAETPASTDRGAVTGSPAGTVTSTGTGTGLGLGLGLNIDIDLNKDVDQ